MKKYVVFLVFTVFLFLSSAQSASAALVVIQPSGEVIQNVLSDDTSSLQIPTHSSIEVKKITDSSSANVSYVSLEKSGNDQISLVISSDNEKKQLDVSKVKDQLVEIEERPTIQKLSLGVQNGMFTLLQNNIKAVTDFPISVDPKTAEITVTTPSGKKYVSVLPYEAVETSLRTKLINTISGNQVKIVEDATQLQYQISGERVFNLFNLYSYKVPVEINLSASTGEIMSLKAPIWYKLIGNLIT